MKANRELAFAVRRALATGTIALCGAGAVAAYGQQATSVQATSAQPTPPETITAPVPAAKAAGAKTAIAKVTTPTAPIVLAQATPPPPAGGSEVTPAPVLQTVVVTGTLIARPAAETAEAITVIDANAIKNLGIVNVEQALNTITSNTPSVNIASSVGSFSGGGTYANLRGLGSARTLVLLDGQRLAGNAFNSNLAGSAVDLSGIPFSAIESIQVLREGASALYGSDAIGGVVNFITRKNYQGAEIDANLDRPQEAGGGSGKVDLTFGHGDLVADGYNFMITASYSGQKELRATQRSFTAEGFDPALGVPNTNDPGTWPATIIDANGAYWQPGFPACAGNPFLTTYYGNCAYRYSAATDLIPKSDEASGLVSFTKQLPANNTLAVQYFYSRSKATGYSGPMFYSFEMTPQADPTYFPTAAGLICETYASTCKGPPALNGPITATWTDPNNNRFEDSINTEQRALVSFSGAAAGWDYKLDLNYSKNENSDGTVGGLPNESVLAPATDPNTGNAILSDLINPFGPQSAAGQALIDSSYVNGVYQAGTMKRWSVSGNASHGLGDAFNAGQDATLAFGFDTSGESYQNATTPLNDLIVAALGLTDNAVSGTRKEQAVFFELDVPMSKSLDVDVSDREDRYSDFGRTNNGKVSVRYQPFRSVTFRGAASTGFRAPTLFNLYSPNFLAASTSGTMGSGNPFCSPGNYTTEWSQAVCNTQGLGLNGGNTHLTPETSQNFDLGVIIEPIRNLGVSLDYYRILLKNTIGHVPAADIYGNPTGLSSYIVPNSQGTLTPSIDEPADCLPYTLSSCGYVLLTDQNTGQITTDGFDLSIQYTQHTRLGTFREDLEATAVTQFRLQQYSGGPTVNMVSAYNGGDLYQPALRWQHDLRVDWTSPQRKWGAGLSNRFYSTYTDEFDTGPTNTGPPRTVGSQSTWDAYASYQPISGLTVLVGINNLLNTNPPFSNSSQNNFAAGYNSLFSDPTLRDFYLNLKYTFL
ncbi:MAG TPA: TonB-dependent receptor [Steroidobacteraceae bacterium]|nr:TonB-dependent receptor [Steroidobacteraceae bacterium]